MRARQGQVQTLLRTAIETNRSGLHNLALLQWNGGSSVTVLAADGRSNQLGMRPGQEPLLGVEMAEALGHAALGLCASDESGALPMAVRSVATGNGMLLLCPVGCSSTERSKGLLLALYDQERPESPGGLHQRQQKQLQLFSQRLGQLLEQR